MKMKKNDNRWLLGFIAVFLFFNMPVFSSGVGKKTGKQLHRIPRITSSIKVDGILGAKEWEKALLVGLDYEVDPGENIKPPVKTEVFLAYDAKCIYVAFRAYDPDPAKIRAHFYDRDEMWSDDWVSIILDTFNDSRRTYNIACNPYGIQGDEIYTDNGYILWDGIWDSAGKINDEGFVVEIAVPFSSLRFQGKKDEQVWGIDAMRVYPRELTHMISLISRDRDNDCYLCQMDEAIGFQGAKPGINLELDPTLFSIVTREREDFPDGKFFKKVGQIEPGLSVRWSFTPSLTLSAAVNPDFSHVEADAAQLDINTQFALYYPEKRPFFLEGASIFNTRLNVVYTRSVAEPEWGIKLSGKEGRHDLAFFVARDAVTNFIFPTSQRSIPQFTRMKNLSTVFRYRLDVGNSSNLGVVITDREGDDYFNRLAGVDGNIRFSKMDRISFQFLGSQTRYPHEVAVKYNQSLEKFTGSAFDIYYTHKSRNVSIYGLYKNVHADFRADIGFIDQADYILYNAGGEYMWRRNPGHWFTNISLGGEYLYNTDQSKFLLRKNFRGWLYYSGPFQSSFNMNVYIGKRTYLGQEFNDNKVSVNAGFRPSGSLFLGGLLGFGDQIDFANTRAGKRLFLNPIISYNIGKRIYLRVDHIFERLKVDAGLLYNANLTNFQAIYHFSHRAFIRAILQYADYQYNAGLYSQPHDPEYKHLFSQVLFSYKLNPRTVLYLGYSDDFYGFSFTPVKQNNYTFFFKIGYALVL